MIGEFLQASPWGEFQKKVGRRVLRFGEVQVIEISLPFGKHYWLVPRGVPTREVVNEARTRGILFLRYEPSIAQNIIPGSKPTIPVSPPTTLILDLTKSEEQLLSEMHEKTRYNIRLAERKGVVVSRLQNFDEFWKLMEETSSRDGFRTHERGYYEKMISMLNPTPYTLHPTPCVTELWAATWQGKTLAAGVWIYFGDTVTYLHGASSSEDRNVMAPYLLHWEVIRDAKGRGCKTYDFWGIAPQKKTAGTESWGGITRFKTGFGGAAVEYPGTYDLPISKFGYTLYRLARKIRRLG